jgi:hypothetical protein
VSTVLTRTPGQTLYPGVLDSTHLRAVVRAALRAHGFDVGHADLEAVFERQQRLGLTLRDEILPARLPSSLEREAFIEAIHADRYLRERLPATAGLGFRHAEAFLTLVGTRAQERDAVAVLGGAFNAAIATLDHVVDDRPAGEDVFGILSDDLVRWIFQSPEEAQAALAAAFADADRPELRILVGLVATCASEGLALVRRNGHADAWLCLGETIARLFASELEASNGQASDDALRRKSAEPALALLQIAQLGANAAEPTDEAQHAALTLGRIFWIVDDLVDLLDDCRSGVPSSLVRRLEGHVRSRGAARASDADVYDLVDECAAELVSLVGELDTLVHPEPGDFAHVSVAAWAGWNEEPPSAPRRRRRSPSAAIAATRYLLERQHESYADAAHRLRLPRLAPAGPQYETHDALLSFRAVAVDALLDARDAGLPVPADVLNSDALSLLRAKHRDVRGGWNYIASVSELPPDADDLGQVLQELVRIGGPALASSCEEPIRMVLDGAHADGGFSTWIIDRRGRSAADDAVRAYLPIMGGWGVHAEVVFNLLYGLLLYDRERYAEPLARATTFLRTSQDSEGWWPSRWYAGRFYGTFKATMVAAELCPADAALDRTRSLLARARLGDGGWGEGQSDPLSTAFALLSLARLGAVPEEAADYLQWTQGSDGGWAACPWISFPTLDGTVTYGSRTMTTAFCLKALLAIEAAP